MVVWFPAALNFMRRSGWKIWNWILVNFSKNLLKHLQLFKRYIKHLRHFYDIFMSSQHMKKVNCYQISLLFSGTPPQFRFESFSSRIFELRLSAEKIIHRNVQIWFVIDKSLKYFSMSQHYNARWFINGIFVYI